jgi:hypothetical protein
MQIWKSYGINEKCYHNFSEFYNKVSNKIRVWGNDFTAVMRNKESTGIKNYKKRLV